MKKVTHDLIMSFDPCYDPVKYIPKDYEGTIIDILKMDNMPYENRFWLVLRPEFLSDKTLRLFAGYCYRQALKFIKNPSPRLTRAANVAEAYALDKATKEESEEAYSSVGELSRLAAGSAGWSVSLGRSATWSGSVAWSALVAESEARLEQINKLIEMIEAEANENDK